MADKGSGKAAKQPQKKFTIGFETEFFVIDKKTGLPAPGTDAIIKKANEKSGGKPHTIIYEVAEEMIEMGSYPNVDGTDTMKSLLENLKLMAYAADEAGYAILPLATYPGKFTPTMRKTPKYNMLKKLFGKKRFLAWGRCTGYHCHYALPFGVFDAKSLDLKDSTGTENQENLVQAYNFLIALDPVLTTFMQSSPFYQGRHIAKDTRAVLFRADTELGGGKEALGTHPLLGVMPPYVHTATDIKHLTEMRAAEWLRWTAEKGISEKSALAPFRSNLGINWSPVRVNAHGTFEQRGMDINRLPILLSVSILMQTLLKPIQEGFVKVVPHDSAKSQPFAFENGTVYIPPDTYVRKTLQKQSVYEGLESDEVYAYCKRALALAKTLAGEKIQPLLEPLVEMLAERKTQSDLILAHARGLGYKDRRKVLPQSIAAEIALTHSKQMFEDIVLLEQMIQINENLSK